jgi:hypothetical protein
LVPAFKAWCGFGWRITDRIRAADHSLVLSAATIAETYAGRVELFKALKQTSK